MLKLNRKQIQEQNHYKMWRVSMGFQPSSCTQDPPLQIHMLVGVTQH